MINYSDYATATTPRTDFALVLLGKPSEAELEERYLALARMLLLTEDTVQQAA